jgi:hypothetical protein
VRAAAARQREVHTLDLAVGGAFGTQLVVRYGTLPVDELDRYAELADNVGNLSLALDMMVRACRTLLWVEADQQHDLEVGLDARLWTLMDWPLPAGMEASDVTAREVVDALFGHNALALGGHLTALVEWMQNPGGDVVGEPSGATS